MTTLFCRPQELLPIDATVYKRKRKKRGKPFEPAPLVKGRIGWTLVGGKMTAYFWDALCWRLVQANGRKQAKRARVAFEELQDQHPAVAGHCTD
jgi:hypothetical protein